MNWREEQREQLAETVPAEIEDTGVGRFSGSDEAFVDCPLCDDEMFDTQVGKHPFSAHWKEIGELAEQRDEE